jgi:1-deoxyxylulose-5-phosphate synthase
VQRRVLGRTGLPASALALGTVELGQVYGIPQPGESGLPTEAEAAAILHRAVDSGINLIDTARAYGAAEEVIGRALAPRRHEIILASKFTLVGPDRAPLTGAALADHLNTSLETSLRALRTDYLDLYQVHAQADPTFLADGVVAECLARAREAGKIRFAGLSSYGLDLPHRGLDLGIFDTLQVAYNVLDRRMLETVLPRAAEQGVGVIVRSALLKGALTDRAEHLPAHLTTLIDASRRFRALARSLPERPSAVQLALRFCMAHPAVSTVLVGIRHLGELEEAVAAAAMPPLDPATLQTLDDLVLTDENLLNPAGWGIP